MKLYSNLTGIFCIWIISVLTTFYFAFSTLPNSGAVSHKFIERFSNWDGAHYLQIANYGYTSKLEYAFFPFYPIAINFVEKITGDFLTAGILISVISTYFALNFLYELISLEFGKQYALKGIIALLFFPFSFHLITVYTEGLFLFLTIGAFLFARKKNYFWASVFAALASVTRLAGLAAVIALIVSYRKNWIVWFASSGFIAYAFYLYIQTGDPFYFISAQSNFWHSGLAIPGSVLFHSLKQLLLPGFVFNNFRDLLDFMFTIFGILMVWKVVKKLSFDYAIFAIISILLPLFSPTLAPMPRYLLTIFPIFIVLNFFKNRYFSIFYQIICLMLMSVYAILYINGYWVS